MKILLTGATGLVGRTLVPHLLAQQHQLTLLVRDVPKTREIFKTDPLQLVEWPNFHRPPAVSGHFDAVIHLMGENLAGALWTKQRKQVLYDSRVLATRNLISAITAQIWIQASAVGYYGARPTLCPSTEIAAPGNDFLARLTQDWERALMAAPTRPARQFCLRLAPILSRDGGILKILKLVNSVLPNVIGQGDNFFPWVALADVVAAIQFILEHAHSGSLESGAYNLCAPEQVTTQQIAQLIFHECSPIRALELPDFATLKIPSFILKGILGEMLEIITVNQQISSHKLESAGFKFACPQLQSFLHLQCQRSQ